MSLDVCLWLLAALLLLCGGALALGTPAVLVGLRRLPRSRSVATVSMVIGALGFGAQVLTLSEADFGSHRWLILGLGLFIAVMAFWHAPDFLAIRGLVVVYLLGADQLLDAGFGRYEPALLFCKAVVYVGVVIALALSLWPYRARDAVEWLLASGGASRVRALGGALLATGAAVAIATALL